jgi:membrane protein implicated in regulation of membrane protease activity
MNLLANFCKGLAAAALLAASPVLIVFAVPFGCGMAGDIADAVGTPAALSLTTAICIATLAWVCYRRSLSRSATREPRHRRIARANG